MRQQRESREPDNLTFLYESMEIRLLLGPSRYVESLFSLWHQRCARRLPQKSLWGVHLPGMPVRRNQVRATGTTKQRDEVGDSSILVWLDSCESGFFCDVAVPPGFRLFSRRWWCVRCGHRHERWHISYPSWDSSAHREPQ